MTEPTPLPAAARDAILDWYAAPADACRSAATTDPYAILVSEAMAQQTQATRAGEAWTRFMDAFPTVASLAAATPADVLRAWHGLGYNRRALNLWRAARTIVEVHGGTVPADLDALRALPGVGPYTARAVAAIAFGMAVGAVDTNVRRVIGRIVAGDPPFADPALAPGRGRRSRTTRPAGRLDARRHGPRRDGLHAPPAAIAPRARPLDRCRYAAGAGAAADPRLMHSSCMNPKGDSPSDGAFRSPRRAAGFAAASSTVFGRPRTTAGR